MGTISKCYYRVPPLPHILLFLNKSTSVLVPPVLLHCSLVNSLECLNKPNSQPKVIKLNWKQIHYECRNTIIYQVNNSFLAIQVQNISHCWLQTYFAWFNGYKQWWALQVCDKDMKGHSDTVKNCLKKKIYQLPQIFLQKLLWHYQWGFSCKELLSDLLLII